MRKILSTCTSVSSHYIECHMWLVRGTLQWTICIRWNCETVGPEKSTCVRKVTIDGQHILFDCNIDTHIDDFVKACANRPVLKAFRNCLTFNKTYEGPLERVLNHKIARDMVAGTTQLSQPHHTKNVLRTFGFWHTSQRITPMKPNIRLGFSKDKND